MKYVGIGIVSLLWAGWAEAATRMHVEMLARPNGLENQWVLQGVNGRKLLCPGSSTYATSCRVDEVIAPADCNWECQDGVLSGQGRSVFLGVFAKNEGRTSFHIEAAWDTWQNRPIRGSLYRVTRGESGFLLQVVDRATKARPFTKLDFSRSDDVNFKMDPTRADDMLSGEQGLLVTGRLQNARFQIDQIWRQWSPRLDCDVWSIARQRAFPEGDDSVDLIFGSLEEATSYQDPEGRSVRWLMWEREEAGLVIFRSGRNDLWSQVFSVATRGCAVTILEEH